MNEVEDARARRIIRFVMGETADRASFIDDVLSLARDAPRLLAELREALDDRDVTWPSAEEDEIDDESIGLDDDEESGELLVAAPLIAIRPAKQTVEDDRRLLTELVTRLRPLLRSAGIEVTLSDRFGGAPRHLVVDWFGTGDGGDFVVGLPRGQGRRLLASFGEALGDADPVQLDLVVGEALDAFMASVQPLVFELPRRFCGCPLAEIRQLIYSRAVATALADCGRWSEDEARIAEGAIRLVARSITAFPPSERKWDLEASVRRAAHVVESGTLEFVGPTLARRLGDAISQGHPDDLRALEDLRPRLGRIARPLPRARRYAGVVSMADVQTRQDPIRIVTVPGGGWLFAPTVPIGFFVDAFVTGRLID